MTARRKQSPTPLRRCDLEDFADTLAGSLEQCLLGNDAAEERPTSIADSLLAIASAINRLTDVIENGVIDEEYEEQLLTDLEQRYKAAAAEIADLGCCGNTEACGAGHG
jgi:hypothetical protein